MVKEKLSNLYDIGSSKRVFQSEWREEGVPFYRAREIARLSEDGHVDNELFIDEDLYEEYTGRYGKPQPGDVMVTGVGTLGVCYVVKPGDKFYFKDGNILWFKQKAPDRILPEYLVKAFDSKEVKDFISKNSSGTTVGTFTIQTANKMEISLPPLDQQKEIIERISKLEAIIKKRQLELEMLDELIKARFVELFGDPDINSKGWDECPLSEKLDVVGGYAFKSDQFDEEYGVPVLRIGNINAGYFRPVNLVFWKEDDALERYVMYPGDLVMSLTGTVGKDDYGNVCILGNEYEKYYLNQRNAKLEIKDGIDKFYLSELLKFEQIKKRLTGISRGVRQANISNKDILNLVVPIPPMEIQNQFAEVVKQVDKSKVVKLSA